MTEMKKRAGIQFLCGLLVLILCILTTATPAQAAVPKITAHATVSNTMKLLKKYDADGYYLVDKAMGYGHSPADWISENDTVIDSINTIVHEECHANVYIGVTSYGTMKIYKGNGKYVTVNFDTDLFRTKKMASSIPKRLRTFRYGTYVKNDGKIPNLASDIQGAYGLLDEFTAYSWGLNNTVSLFDYYVSKAKGDFTKWAKFINHGANDRQAYAEFKYYILHYLYFAKTNYPKVYKAFMNNANFKKAFKAVDKKYRSNIKKYNADLKKIRDILQSKGHTVSISGDYYYCDGYGIGTFKKDYDKLIKETNKTKYKKIYNKLIG